MIIWPSSSGHYSTTTDYLYCVYVIILQLYFKACWSEAEGGRSFDKNLHQHAGTIYDYDPALRLYYSVKD
jgi:hypothetical protein